MNQRTLVAGVGNIFLADDGFGVEVARRLAVEPLPAGIEVVDFGTRGVHLAYQLLDGYGTLILIDAACRGEPPGTVFVLQPDFSDQARLARGDDGFVLDAHSLDPELVLAMLKDLGGGVERVFIVGCEPAEIQERIGLSAPVTGAIEQAMKAVRELIATPSAIPSGEGRERKQET